MTRVSLKGPGFYSYLIITPESFVEPAESLKVYREKEGYITKILTVEEIEENFTGQDIQEKIRNAIRAWHMKLGVEYVFLAADADSIPPRTVLVRLGYGDDDYIPSDYYYMCLDGNWNSDGDYTFGEIEDSVDLYPDVAVTRGTFHSAIEFMDYVDRIKYFEKSVGSYAKRALFHSSTIQTDADGSYYVNQIADAFPDSVEKHFLYQDEQSITISDINNYLREGVGYFLTMAHGDINGFYANYSNEYYGISDIPDDSTNSTFIDIFSCHSGAIDRTCLLEGFFQKEVTIAARASSRNDFSFTTPMRVHFYENITSGKSLGDATRLYRLPYLSYAYSGDNGYRYVIMSMITLGEPLLRFYTLTPQNLYMNYYEDSMYLHVVVFSEDSQPASQIKVVLYKDGEYIIIDTTDASGEVRIPLRMLTRGLHSLSLTGWNFHRVDTTLYVNGYFRPSINSIAIKGNSEERIISGDSAVVTIRGSVPSVLPLWMRISCFTEDGIFYDDSFKAQGEFIVSDTVRIPWFSGQSLFSCRAAFESGGFYKDTSLIAYGPLIALDGIRYVNDSLVISLVNAACVVSDTVYVKVNTSSNQNYYFSTVLGPEEIRKIRFKIEESDLPLSIGIHSHVIDTQFIIKEIMYPQPPQGLTTVSISEGVKLTWEEKNGAYNLYRGTDSLKLVKINLLPLKYPYYVDRGLSFDTVYYYAVTFVDSFGFESGFSDIVKGIPNPKMAPGWPATASGLGYSSPLVADITPLYPGKEIVIGSFEDSLVYAFSKDGIPLPGWPVNIGDIIYSAPASYDLDGDGYDEVIVAGGGSYTNVWVLKGDGTVLDGWPVYVRKGNFTGPAVADLNGDSLPEIVFVSRSGGVYVYNIHGVMLDSIHLYAGGFSPASLGDVNNDDTMDIVIGCKADSAGLWILHMVNDTELVVNNGFPKGSFLFNSPLVIGDVRPDIPGLEIFGCDRGGNAILFNSRGDTIWTRPVNNLDYFYNPSISDVDGDGVPELLVNQGTGVAVFKNDGSYLEGYPTTEASGGPHQCITVDLNGDGYKEIIKGSVDGKLYALTENADIYPGFPIDLNGYAYPTSTISDLDGDSTLELISASFSSMVFVYELGVPDSFIGDWPTYQHDNQRTGNYNYIPPLSFVREKEHLQENSVKNLVVRGSIYFGKQWKDVLKVDLYDITGRRVFSIKKPFGHFVKLDHGVYFGIIKMKNGYTMKNRIIVLP